MIVKQESALFLLFEFDLYNSKSRNGKYAYPCCSKRENKVKYLP